MTGALPSVERRGAGLLGDKRPELVHVNHGAEELGGSGSGSASGSGSQGEVITGRKSRVPQGLG